MEPGSRRLDGAGPCQEGACQLSWCCGGPGSPTPQGLGQRDLSHGAPVPRGAAQSSALAARDRSPFGVLGHGAAQLCELRSLGKGQDGGTCPVGSPGPGEQSGCTACSHPRATSAPLSCTHPPTAALERSCQVPVPAQRGPAAARGVGVPAEPGCEPRNPRHGGALSPATCVQPRALLQTSPVSDDLSGCSAGAQDSVILPPLRARSRGQATCARRLRARLLGERRRPSRPHAAPRRCRCCQEHGPGWAPASPRPQRGQGARRVTKIPVNS